MKKRLSKKQIAKNRLWAVMLATLGFLTTLIDGDATAFIFMLMIAMFAFFSTSVEIH